MMLIELDGYAYPGEYRTVREQDGLRIRPWQFIDDIDEATTIRKEFLLEVGRGSIAVRDILPFAKHSINDDYAGFIQKDGRVTGEICVVHLTFRQSAEVSGYPLHTVYPSLDQWLDTLEHDQ